MFYKFTILCLFLAVSMPTLAEDKGWDKQGETLHYDVYWAFIKAGEATLKYTPKENRKYQIQCRSWTTSGVKSLFTLNDTITVEGKHSLVHGFLPDLYNLKLFENDYRADKNVQYKHGNREAIYTNVWGNEAPRGYPIEGNTRDMISALYYLRATQENPKPGDEFSLPVFELDRPYLMTLKILSRENVEVGDYEIPAIHVQPVLKGVEEDRTSDKWHLWVTDDGSFTPVKIMVDLKVGSFKAELRSRRVGNQNVSFGQTLINEAYNPAAGF